jgi:hypothetical protein
MCRVRRARILLHLRIQREKIVCVCFITAGPITKLGEESGGHVL